MRSALILLLVLCAGCYRPQDTNVSHSLPALGADATLSVVGISSGGYMAGQYHLAFADTVDHAGIVAAGPWGCSGGELATALGACASGDGIEVDALQQRAAEAAAAGRIAPLSALAGDQVFLFHGSNDVVVAAPVVAATAAFYAPYLDGGALVSVDSVPATHGWPTADAGADCASFGRPYINDCDYDLAGTMLEFFAQSTLAAPAETPPAAAIFDQTLYGDAGLASQAYVFIPDTCREEPGCSLVVVFHGCDQSAATIGDALVEQNGLNRWAATNRIVVLYPQVAPSAAAPMNPYGCWDWWGYSDSDYLSREAPQLAAVNAMIARLRSRD